MVAPAHHRFSFSDYVQMEASSPIRHEFLDGQVWAMAGGTPDHAAIAANVITQLSIQLQGKPCRVFTADLRIRILATGLATYPDVSVICGRVELDPNDPTKTTAVNPKVLVEVLSPSTEDYDRGEKRMNYQQIDSLEAIVLIAHEERRVDIWRREQEGWSCETVKEGSTAKIPIIEGTLSLDDIYRNPLSDAG